MHKKKGKQICLPLKSMSVQRQTALKTNLPLIGLLRTDSAKALVKAGDLTF